jgi:hypothetical protein
MSPQSSIDRLPPRIVAAGLRPLVVALAAALLAAGSVSPAIARSPATGEAAATTRASFSESSLAPFPLASRGVAASAAGVAEARPPAARPVHVLVLALPTKPAKASASLRTLAATSFSGTNHIWIPALGIDRGTLTFPCSRTQAPANYVYRWGCAGTNNVYLIGHAYGVFKALHDAYYNGRLKVGLTAVYADGAGRIHTYRVAWWRVVRPTTAASWAWASLATPSMTLQTCLGADSEYRLMVRLVRVS